MREYFRNLDSVDPLFHSLVVAKLRELERNEPCLEPTIEDLSEEDELEILRKYCVTLYKEYRTLRTVFLENMVVTTKSVGVKHSSN